MADSIKVLGQLEAAATTSETLYTVPDLHQTTCSALVVCNRTAGALTFRVHIRVNGAATANKQAIYYGKSIAANASFTPVLGLTLNQGDIVETWASATGLSFALFGVETS